MALHRVLSNYLRRNVCRISSVVAAKRNYLTSAPQVIVENTKNNKKVLTLNRPKALNALSLEMTRSIMKEIMAISSEPSSSNLVIIKSSNERAFCAGGDVVAVTNSYKQKTNDYRDFFYEEYKLNHMIGTLKVPFVALMDGITFGGGCGISVNGKFRVATERTQLAMPETALGLFPDCGGTYFLSRMQGKLGLFMGLTGHRLLGSDVFHSGLATHYVKSKNLDALAQALIKLPAEKCTEAGVNDLLTGFQDNSIEEFTLKDKLEIINRCFAATTLEGIFKNLEKEEDAFAKAQLARLRTMSPTSLKITFRQLEEGASLEFAQVFPVEYRLNQRFFADYDFHEGCRAILIDKDHKPKWKPSRIEEVTQQKVDYYFSPFDNKTDELVLGN